MKRLYAILILSLVVSVSWWAVTSPATMAILSSANSIVLFTYEGFQITPALAFILIVLVVAWFALGMLLSSINSYTGYVYFKVTIEIFMREVMKQKDYKFPEYKNGNGSGNTASTG